MADYRLANLLPLESFRRILGYNPWHFWGMADNTIVPVTSSCNDYITQHSWQDTDAVGRDGIIEAIINAEFRIAEELGFYPAPAYFDKTIEWAKFHDQGLWNMSHGDAQARWLDVRLPWGYVEAVGPETRTLIATVNITYSDQDGDGLRDLFTISNATTVTDPNEIAVYFSAANRLMSDPVGEEYRIAPVKVAIAAGTVTIRGPAWLCIAPISYEGADLHNPIDPTNTGANYVTTLDIYRRYASTSGTTYDTSQAALIWESEPYPDMAACCCCATTTTVDTDPAAVAYGVARAGIRHAKEGIVNVGSASYDTINAVWKSVNWGMCRPPERVAVRFRAGYPLSDTQMDRGYQAAIARLAAAELARPLCACDEANRELYRWQFDLARTGGANDESYTMVSAADLDNPFGTRRGHVYAWRFVKERRNLIGFSM